MSISYANSLNEVGAVAKSAQVASENVPAAAAFSEEVAPNEGNWERDDTYEQYVYVDNEGNEIPEYHDDKISTVDEEKNIVLGHGQLSLEQEENSQYVQFEMPLRYDGFDLSKTAITIHYDTSAGKHYSHPAVDVMYNRELGLIRYSWLIEGDATQVPGKLILSIHADGVNSKGKAYRWKTKPYDKIVVHEALCTDCDGDIEIDDSWVQKIVDKVGEQIAEANLDTFVTEARNAAEEAAESAINSANAATSAVNEALEEGKYTQEEDSILVFENPDGDTGYVNRGELTTKLSDYYTETETNAYIEGKLGFGEEDKSKTVAQFVEDKGYLTEHQSLDGYALKTEIPTNVSAFTNDAGYLTTHQSLDNYPTKGELEQAIKGVNVTEQLQDYALKSELPDLDGYATEDFVAGKLGKIVAVTTETDEETGETTTTETPVTVKEYVDTAVANIDISDRLGDIKDGESNDITVEKYVAQEIGKVDVSAQIDTKVGDIGENTVKAYVDNKVSSVDVSKQLEDYATTEDVKSQLVGLAKEEYVEERLGDLGEVITGEGDEAVTSKKTVKQFIENGYYNKIEVDNKDKAVSDVVTTHTENINKLIQDVAGMGMDVDEIKGAPRHTYDITYGKFELEDGTEQDNVIVLWETANGGEPEVKSRYQITGGGGGASTSNTLQVFYDKNQDGQNINSYVFTEENVANKEGIIKYEFLGTDPMGDTIASANVAWAIKKQGTTSWQTVFVGIANAGMNSFNVGEYLSAGKYDVKIIATDESGGYISKTWSVQLIQFKIESKFNDKISYTAGDVSISYIPYGSIDKTVHIIVDGKEFTKEDKSSGGTINYTLVGLTHGSHLVEMFMTAVIAGNDDEIESNHIFKDVICMDGSSADPVIGTAYQKFTARQYDTTNIEYTVYDPLNAETPSVDILVNGEMVSSLTLETPTNIYNFKADTVGEYIIEIKCRDVVKRLVATITELDIDVAPVTAGLLFDFNPVGRSNQGNNRLWEDVNRPDVHMSVSDNFDWVNGGYQRDENQDQYFCVKAGTRATITCKLFEDDPKTLGKEFKVIFKTTNVRKRATSFIQCMNDGIGLDMCIEKAFVHCSSGVLKSDYCEDTIIEYEFNINKYEDMPIVMSYEDGTPSTPFEYSENTSFKQQTAQPIVIGSDDCDIHIYRMKAYSNSLSDVEIMKNFIADARNATEMIQRHDRNQIFDENNALITTSASGGFSADALMQAAPDLRYVFLEAPRFTVDKSDEVSGCTVYFRYPNGKRPEDNWTCRNASHQGQGTSSNEYGESGRNMDLIMDHAESVFEWVDENGETVTASTIALSENSVPTDYLNIKVNIASSENANNAGMAKRFNDYQPFVRYAKLKNPKVKDTMEFYNCVVFIRETADSDHSEFNDANWHFYAIGNIGDSKKTDDTRVNDKNDPKEHVVEIMDADVDLAGFPTGMSNNAICPGNSWRAGNSSYDILYSDYKYKDGKFKSFGNGSYEFRYEKKGITEEQRETNIDAWRKLYKFVVTASDEDFHDNLKHYFVVDSALYFYLFTERYTMVDNRAKNTFWHYGKAYYSQAEAQQLGLDVSNPDVAKYIDDIEASIDEGYRYDLTFGYDFDTCLGIDNTGNFVFPYGKEDTDYYDDASGKPIFRVADSVFFCRLRDNFTSELELMFKDREAVDAWKSESLIKQWDDAQAQFPEQLWRLDYERKYYRTYAGISIDNSIVKHNTNFLKGKFFGRKKYARRAFETDNDVYFASKYFGNKILLDSAYIRGYLGDVSSLNPVPNYFITLTPYSDMYLCMKYGSAGSNPIHSSYDVEDGYEGVLVGKPRRIKAGESYTFKSQAQNMDFVYFYGVSRIQAIDDLSLGYINEGSFSKAKRLQKLVIGSTREGYNNPNLETLDITGNPLLEYLDIRNASNFAQDLDIKTCHNLKELYAENTRLAGVYFANGGLLETAHLPGTITTLSMKNLSYLKDFQVDGYRNIRSLIVENCPNLNTYEIVKEALDAGTLRSLRLIDMDWEASYEIPDGSIFADILADNNQDGKPDIGGLDSSNKETDVAVLTGKAYTAVIGTQETIDYTSTWPNLKITAGETKRQYKVTFVNDGEIIDEQYVEIFQSAKEPETPTKKSTVQYDYIFVGWDKDVSNITAERVITAMYEPVLRKYKVQYVSYNGTLIPGYENPIEGSYGEYIPYSGEIPTYTIGEPYIYRLFSGWDKSGYLDGNEEDFDENGLKIITAQFDEFAYDSTVFETTEIGDLTPVQLYALTKKGVKNVNHTINSNDSMIIQLGNDVDYADIESQVIIGKGSVFGDAYNDSVVFDGTIGNYFDTGIELFNNDKDFVLAIDYEFLEGNGSGAILAQCFEANGTNGWKLSYSNGSFAGAGLTWGTTSAQVADATNREMLIMRHKAGSPELTIYKSVLSAEKPTDELLTASKVPITTEGNSLIFGCSKTISGGDIYYENYAKGIVHWCKVWYKDLGEEMCKSLAEWIHEKVEMQVCSRLDSSGSKHLYGRYMDSFGTMTQLTLVAKNLLNRKLRWGEDVNNGNNEKGNGAWANSRLFNILNSRVYEALPVQIKSLVKNVRIPIINSEFNGIDYVDSYITIPSYRELDFCEETMDVYGSEGTEIDNMGRAEDRAKSFYNDGEKIAYWLRTPYISNTTSAWTVRGEESTSYQAGSAYQRATYNIYGVLIMFSF